MYFKATNDTVKDPFCFRHWWMYRRDRQVRPFMYKYTR